MNDITHMTKCYSLDHLVYEKSQAFWVDSSSVLFEYLQKIFLDILEYKVKSAFSKQINRINFTF